MKSGFDRIGHTVTQTAAKRSCLEKIRYPSRNHARDAAAKNGKRYPETARWIYRCTLCHGFHLTSKPPASLGKNNGKRKGATR